MTAKQQLIERAPGFSEGQAQAALSAAERQRGDAFAAISAPGDAFAGLDSAEIEAEGVKAGKQVRADRGAAAGDLEGALAGLAALRDTLGEVDGVAVAREARSELEQRGVA